VSAPVLLLHGFTQTGRAWDGVRAALGPARRVLAPDLLGHGGLAERVPVSFDAQLALLSALAPPEPVVVGGYSMGGRIALLWALARPERVARLVLVGATAGIEDPDARATRRAEDEARIRELEAEGLERWAERWGAQPLFAGQPADVAARAHADRLRNTAPGLAAALRGLGTGAMPSVWDRLPGLTVPVVLAAGERDDKFQRIAEAMAARLPAALVETIAGAGHAAHLEAPEAVAALLAP
jgi:2-succinyl-6-hydroxy-2,4-cyclohexadiene-1-carboxylate synthase